MISDRKDITFRTVNNKQYIEDEFIDVNFVIKDMNISSCSAYKIIKEANKLQLKETGFKPLIQGKTTLRYYYKLNGLSGEFIWKKGIKMKETLKSKELIRSVKKYYKLEKQQKDIKDKLFKARVNYIEKKLLYEIEELNRRITEIYRSIPPKKD